MSATSNTGEPINGGLGAKESELIVGGVPTSTVTKRGIDASPVESVTMILHWKLPGAVPMKLGVGDVGSSSVAVEPGGAVDNGPGVGEGVTVGVGRNDR